MDTYFRSIAAAVLMASGMTGCGTVVPQIGEIWEERDINSGMAYTIKKKIFCELVDAIDETNRENALILPNMPPVLPLPDDYGVQMQTTLTIEENSSLNPLVTLNRTLPNGFAAGITNIGQNYNIGFGGAASSTATRTDTSFSYYQVGKISRGSNAAYCRSDKDQANYNLSSPLIRSNLGIKEFLVANTRAALIIRSSSRGKAKTAKLDVYSYEIKFVVLTNANVNPTWKLVPVSGGGGLPLAGTGRTRTHDLILTFGPNGEDGFQPALVSLNQHLAAQFKSAAEGIRQNQ